MALGQTLTDADGHVWQMADLLSVKTSFAKRKMTLGYRDATLLSDTPLGQKTRSYAVMNFITRLFSTGDQTNLSQP